jgi:hypothetical protein
LEGDRVTALYDATPAAYSDLSELLLGDNRGTFEGLLDVNGSALCFFGDLLELRGGTTGVGISASGLRGEFAMLKMDRSGELTGELRGMPGKSSLNGIIEAAMRSGETGGLFAGVLIFAGLVRCGERFLRDGDMEKNFSRGGGLRGDVNDVLVGDRMGALLKILGTILSWKTSSDSIDGEATLKAGSLEPNVFGVLRGVCCTTTDSALGDFFGDCERTCCRDSTEDFNGERLRSASLLPFFTTDVCASFVADMRCFNGLFS